MRKTRRAAPVALLASVVLSLGPHAWAGQNQASSEEAPAPSGVPLPRGYVIGPEDVLGVLVWREADVSGDVTVRPDGMITLPLVGDTQAAGIQPETLASQIETLVGEYLTEPNVTVIVRQVNSRKAFITGEITEPGAYPLIGPLTVVQLIALAGGLTEFADQKRISIVRTGDDGQTKTIRFNYKWITEGKELDQNIQLRPGDTVVVP